MSMTALQLVFDGFPESGTSKLVMIKIADHADDFGACSWPSMKTISMFTNTSVRTVQRMINHLQENDWIEVSQRNTGRSMVNNYHLNMGKLAESRRERHPDFAKKGDKGVTLNSSLSTETGELSTEKGDIGVTLNPESYPQRVTSGVEKGDTGVIRTQRTKNKKEGASSLDIDPQNLSSLNIDQHLVDFVITHSIPNQADSLTKYGDRLRLPRLDSENTTAYMMRLEMRRQAIMRHRSSAV